MFTGKNASSRASTKSKRRSMPYVEARTKSHGLKECASFRRSCAAACQTSLRASTCVARLHGNEKKRAEGAEEFTVGAGVGVTGGGGESWGRVQRPLVVSHVTSSWRCLSMPHHTPPTSARYHDNSVGYFWWRSSEALEKKNKKQKKNGCEARSG